MTEGPIGKQLITFAAPLLLGDILQLFYNMADSAIVGNLVSKQALAAVGGTTPIINIFIGIFAGISLGATVKVSRVYGAQDFTLLTKVVRTVFWIAVVMGIIFTAAGVPLVPLMLRMMNTPADVMPDATVYLRIYFAGILGMVVYNMIAGILRAVGDSRRPMYLLAFCAVLNIILDIVFIHFLGMGVDGAAYATIISQFLSGIILMILMVRTELFGRLELYRPYFDPETVADIFRVGIPVSIQRMITSVSNTMVNGYINYFESGAMAAWGVFSKIDTVIMMTIMSMASSVTTFVSQNLGAGRRERCRRGINEAFKISFVICGLLSAAVIAARYPIYMIFNRDPEVLAFGSLFVLTQVPLQIFNMIPQIYAGALRGEGDSKSSMYIMVLSYVVLRQIYLFLIWQVSKTIIPVLMCYPFTWMVCDTAFLLYVRYKRKNDPQTAL